MAQKEIEGVVNFLIVLSMSSALMWIDNADALCLAGVVVNWISSILCLKTVKKIDDDPDVFFLAAALNVSISLLVFYSLQEKQMTTAEPIFRSVQRGDIRGIEYILSKNGAAVEFKDKVYGNTPLHLAAEKGNLLVVEKLLDYGADMKAKNKSGDTPLHLAAEKGNLLIVNLLLENGADFEFKNERGETPLDRASRFHKTASVEYLLERYAEKIMGQGGRLRSISLHQILQDATYHPRNSPYRLTEKMQLPVGLLSFDQFCSLLYYLPAESIRSRNDDGSLPLHVACRKGTPLGYIRLLARKHSAALQTPDTTGALPLHIACQTATPLSLGLIRFLVEQEPAALHTPNNVGALPFHLLCGASDPPLDVLKYLMRTDPESLRAAMTNAGALPVMMAGQASLRFILELLMACPDALPH